MRPILRVCLCAVIMVCLLSTGAATRDGSGADAVVGWETAMLIETSTGNAEEPQVAADSQGNAIAVWTQYDGTLNSIYSNRYEVGRGWWAATLIETGDEGSAEDPQVAIDGSGNAIAVWKQFDGFRDSIYSNRHVVGAGWGEAQLVETDDMATARYPQVAVDASGNATAVWVQTDFASSAIWSNRYVVGTGWGEAQLIETNDAGFAELPKVAVDGSGNAIAVWYRTSEVARWDVWSNRFEIGAGWGDAELIETDDTGDAERPQVAVDASGNAIAVWYQNIGTFPSIWSNRYVVGEGWGDAQLLEDDEDAAYSADIAVDASGSAMAAWVQYDGFKHNVWSNRYVVGAGWGDAQLVDADAGDAYEPNVAVDSTGNATVVWDQLDDGSLDIWSNRYETGVGWGEAQLIEIHVDGDEAANPSVAVDGLGNAITVWQQHDGDRWNTWSNRYVVPDVTPPSLSLDSPSDGFSTDTPVVMVSGSTERGVNLAVNGVTVAVDPDGTFSCLIVLIEGANAIIATATDAWGNSASISVSVTYVNPVRELEEELYDAKDELVYVRNELNSTKDDLDTVIDELDSINDELNSTQADLDVAEDALDATEDDLNAIRSQNLLLMAVLTILVALAVVMSLMFLSIRKKISNIDIKNTDEVPPPPQS